MRFYAAVPLRTHDAHNLGTLCVIDKEPRPITEHQIEDLKDLASIVMDQLELRLSARLAVGQAQMMGREIDHRVMNSLQFVSAMLTMQGRASGNPDVSDHLQIAANRVNAVARVHRHFYLDEPAESVECLTYLRRLCEDLAGILQARIEVGGTEAMVRTTQLQPIGLVINELVTNAAKHGSGKIKVTFNRIDEGNFSLCVLDEGPGLPPDFDLAAQTDSLGMKLVSVLTRQLQGELAAMPNPAGRGAWFTMTFPSRPG